MQRFESDVYETLIKRTIFDGSDEIEMKHHATDLFEYFGKYLVAFAYSDVLFVNTRSLEINLSHLFTH